MKVFTTLGGQVVVEVTANAMLLLLSMLLTRYCRRGPSAHISMISTVDAAATASITADTSQTCG